MKSIVIAYFATLVGFLALDSVWLSTMGNRLYRPVMGDMLLDGFRPAPAIIFYLLYIAALVYFVVKPGLTQGFWPTLINAALLGVACYATYDLTNQATLKNWSTTLTLADLCWGAIVTAFGASVGRAVTLWAVGP
jgi:uncharacterized membrane protein